MNLRKTALALGFILLLAAPSSLCAQTGCVDSPEDPTVVLALFAIAGAFAASFRGSRRRNQ
ncbi:MAG TPA: PExPT-CTERM protein [Terracidiphilus sp.]|nr:PExPT-CTERM protein [Terracidiphilus sp.]